ncbi:hypothetical protein [Vibrio parahaemolyticus]|uniref:hypothetical protein n=1 Tax=Vibrio parahaemolyticus TaxID=670 RepID=UPI0009F0B5DB|nr:hypothetical protein [Vibrio parahaemolyticus]OQU28100.1 hypothetical protein EM47_001255 [Vibrio parahaemolyticus]
MTEYNREAETSANQEQSAQISSQHRWDSEAAKQAQEKSVQSRLENRRLRDQLRQEALQLIKQKTMIELADELKINVNLSNEAKQDIYGYLLKSLIDVEVVETAKHRFKTEQMFIKQELDEMTKSLGEHTKISIATGEQLTIEALLEQNKIDLSSLGEDTLNKLRSFI